MIKKSFILMLVFSILYSNIAFAANNDRFTRARKVTVTANNGTYEHTYIIPQNRELTVTELALSSTKAVICELQYSEDNGSTWINPWDSGATHLLWLMLGPGIPASGKPTGTYFQGDGANTKLRIKLTNIEDQDATVFFLVKGHERDS